MTTNLDEPAQGFLHTVRVTGGKPWGFTAKEIFKNEDNNEVLLIISKVDPKGKSADVLFLNDILLAVDGLTCHTVLEARNQIQDAASDTLALTVWRKGHTSQSCPQKKTSGHLPSNAITETEASARRTGSSDSYEYHPDPGGQCTTCDDVIVPNHDVTAGHSQFGGSSVSAHEEEDSSAAEETDTEEKQDRHQETDLTMESFAPEISYHLKSRQQQQQQQPHSHHTPGQRGSLSSVRLNLYSDRDDDDSVGRRHSDFMMSAHARPRASVDAYPMCGLPSGTLYRKSTSSASLRSPSSNPLDMPYTRPLSGALLPGAPSVFRPIRNSQQSALPEEFVEVYRSFTTKLSEFTGSAPLSFHPASPNKLLKSPTQSTSLSASALGAKSQKMMDLLHNQAATSKNVYHATPASQWSQTESSSTTVYQSQPSERKPNSKAVPKSQSTDFNLSVSTSSPAISQLDTSTFSAGPAADCHRTGSDGLLRDARDSCKLKDRMDSRTPLAPISVNQQPDRRKMVSSTVNKSMPVPSKVSNTTSAFPEKKDDHSSLETSHPTGIKSDELGGNFRELNKMPALRPNHFIALPDDGGAKSPHLTTMKEVRTYQIRPSLSAAAAADVPSVTGALRSPVSLRSSARSTPDEGTDRHPVSSSSSSHTREASLDSHVSWQSNSTNSSGYSSVALSSSTPMLDMAVSEETLVPTEYMNLQEGDNVHNCDYPVSRSASKASLNTSAQEPEIPRSVSVSEMIRNFGHPVTKTPPQPPPKPRYAHLPAQRPNTAQSEPRQPYDRLRGNSIPNSTIFASMDDVRSIAGETAPTHRSTTNSQAHVPILVEETNKGTISKQQPASPPLSSLSRSQQDSTLATASPSSKNSKPVPTFRTAVHGVVLGGNRTSPEKSTETSLLEDPGQVAASPVSLEDRGYGSGEIHYIPEEAYVADQNQISASSTAGLAANPVSVRDGRLREVESSGDEEDLHQKKEDLKASLSRRTELLKEEQNNIQQEILANDELGERIARELAKVTSSSDLARFKQHIKELDEMTSLTISLTSRLSRIDLSMANLRFPADEIEMSTLQSKKRKLESQYEDAVYLQKGVDRRRQAMRSFLSQCLSEKLFEEYDNFFTTKTSLLRDVRNLDDKIRLGEEQLRCLQNSGA